ncbi:MAG: type A2 lantipeptide [Lachnospiraceae bacterium]|nr:type A2 lantipeptide [Candidatus Colinaster equi]
MKKSEKYTMDEIKALSELSESELDNIVGGTDTEEGKDADDSSAGLCPVRKFCVEHMGRAHRICNMVDC